MKITTEEMAQKAGPANGKYHPYDIRTDSILPTFSAYVNLKNSTSVHGCLFLQYY